MHKNKTRSRDLEIFVSWLLSRKRQKNMTCGERTFRSHFKEFWELWPLPSPVDKIHRVVYVDGL